MKAPAPPTPPQPPATAAPSVTISVASSEVVLSRTTSALSTEARGAQLPTHPGSFLNTARTRDPASKDLSAEDTSREIVSGSVCNGSDLRAGVSFVGGTFMDLDVNTAADCCGECVSTDGCTHWTFQSDVPTKWRDGKARCRLKRLKPWSQLHPPPPWERAQKSSANVFSGRVDVTKDTRLEEVSSTSNTAAPHSGGGASGPTRAQQMLRGACTAPPNFRPPVYSGFGACYSSDPPHKMCPGRHIEKEASIYPRFARMGSFLCGELQAISQRNPVLRFTQQELTVPTHCRNACVHYPHSFDLAMRNDDSNMAPSLFFLVH